MGMMDAPAGDQQTPQDKPKKPASGMMADPNAGQQTTGGGQTTGGQTTGGGQTGGGGQQAPPPPSQASSWTLNPQTWNVPLPQSVQDWGTVANNEQLMGSLPGLKTQAEAARQRLGPIAAGTADAVGSALSPTSVAYAIPFVGPEVAGGLHEGIKSAIANWKPDESWWDYAKNVGEDTVAGAAWGGAGHVAAAAAPVIAPPLTKLAVAGGGPMAATGLTHMLFGHSDIPREIMGGLANMGVLPEWWKAGKTFSDASKYVLSAPAAQQAIKSLVLGGGSAVRNAAGPYDQWIPGQ